MTEVLAQGLESHEPSADAQLQKKQLARRLSAEVGRLSERAQLVLQLHYVEGLTYREIGGILEVSEVRICQIHKQALENLGAAMKGEAA
ncbi:MAG: sigma-70 family RNA polymerase sigma factor [Myxococcaceae bacterium]|nr:sigma-70 family RNA polymerase sigma factor [Myxococcaceae bacterium]